MFFVNREKPSWVSASPNLEIPTSTSDKIITVPITERRTVTSEKIYNLLIMRKMQDRKALDMAIAYWNIVLDDKFLQLWC